MQRVTRSLLGRYKTYKETLMKSHFNNVEHFMQDDHNMHGKTRCRWHHWLFTYPLIDIDNALLCQYHMGGCMPVFACATGAVNVPWCDSWE